MTLTPLVFFLGLALGLGVGHAWGRSDQSDPYPEAWGASFIERCHRERAEQEAEELRQEVNSHRARLIERALVDDAPAVSAEEFRAYLRQAAAYNDDLPDWQRRALEAALACTSAPSREKESP